MKSITELYKQLNHLAATVSQCNYIAYEDKKDLVQQTITKLVEKYNEGIIVDDFNEIKGYSFMTLRNYCTGFRKKNKPIYTDEPVDLVESEFEVDLTYRDYLHELVLSHLQNKKYSEIQRKVCLLLLDDCSDREILEELDILPEDLSKLKYNIKRRLNADMEREVKYIIYHNQDKNIRVPCYSKSEVNDFFPDITPRTITHLISFGFHTKDGYYIESLVKKKKVI